MVASSKMHQVLDTMMTEVCCHDLVHPFTTRCSLAVLDMAWAGYRGSCKYFLIMYVLQLLLKGRKVSREYLKNHLKGFLQSALFGSIICGTFITACCGLRASLGRYHHYTVVALPGFIAGLTIFCERPFRRSMYLYTFVQEVLEYFVRVLEEVGIGPMSTKNETMVFMVSNAILLFLLKRTQPKEVTYWIFRPPSSVPEKSESVNDETHEKDVTHREDCQHVTHRVQPLLCPHTESCKSYIFKSICQYAGAGVGIQLLQGLLSKMKHVIKSPSKTLRTILCNSNTFKLGAFLGAYIGIYKTISCLLCQSLHGDSDYYALVAGFLAGSTYYLNPARALALSSITTILQLCVQRGISNGLLPDLPHMKEIGFALCCCVLFHARYFDTENCPRLISNMMGSVTRGRSDYIYRTYMKQFDKFSKKLMISI